jgi:hypothetical protein
VGVAETMRGERFLVYEDEMQSGEVSKEGV